MCVWCEIIMPDSFMTGEAFAILAKAQARAEALHILGEAVGKEVSICCHY